MAYTDYLPTKAGILFPSMRTGEVTIDSQAISRTYLDGEDTGPDSSYPPMGLTSFKEAYNTTTIYYQDVVDSTPEYAIGGGSGTVGYLTGDEVQVNALGLKYRYSGTEELEITAGNFDTEHPSAINDTQIRANSTVWANLGPIDELAPFDGSNSSGYANSAGGVNDYGMLEFKFQLTPADVTAPVGLFLAGFTNVAKATLVFDDLVTPVTTVVAMTHRDKLFVLIPAETYYVTVTLASKEDSGSGNPTFKSAVSTVVYGYYSELGAQLTGHSQNRTAEFRAVVSDGIEKQMVVKAYDVFGGTITVESADLPLAEYLLAKATQGDYVFHTGTGEEIFDQRVYLGRIKYQSPISTNNKYKIQISGQSLSYDVENPLVAPDSTSGYPV